MSTHLLGVFNPRRRFSRWVQFGLPLLGLTLLWLLYHWVQLLFTSLMIAWGLFYILNPLVDKIEARSISRTAASAMVLIGFCLLIYLVWLRFLTFSIDLRGKISLDVFEKNLAGSIQKIVATAEEQAPFIKRFTKNPSNSEGPGTSIRHGSGRSGTSPEPVTDETPLPERLIAFLEQEIMKRTPGIAMKVAGLIPNLILIPYFTFFFLKDGRHFKKTLIEWIPNRYFEPALKFFYELDRRMQLYLQSLLLDCTLVGLLVGIGSGMVGAPYPVVFGFIAFILNSIPLLGPLLYGAICLILTIGAGSSPEVIFGFLFVFVLSRVCDDLIFIPTIYGKSHHLHPVLVVCAVLLGESMAGIWGMFLAIPIVSILFLGLGIIREISIGEETRRVPHSLTLPFS